MKRFIVTFIIFFFVFSIVQMGFSRASKSMVGEKAPEIQATAWVNSDVVKLADNLNRPIVVEFWATWCPPCRRSIPHLIEIYKKYHQEGVLFVSLTKEPYETVKSFAQDMKMPYPIGTGCNSGADYNVAGIPHAVIIDHQGKIVWQGHPMDNLAKQLDSVLEKMPKELREKLQATESQSVIKTANPVEPK